MLKKDQSIINISIIKRVAHKVYPYSGNLNPIMSINHNTCTSIKKSTRTTAKIKPPIIFRPSLRSYKALERSDNNNKKLGAENNE